MLAVIAELWTRFHPGYRQFRREAYFLGDFISTTQGKSMLKTLYNMKDIYPLIEPSGILHPDGSFTPNITLHEQYEQHIDDIASGAASTDLLLEQIAQEYKMYGADELRWVGKSICRYMDKGDNLDEMLHNLSTYFSIRGPVPKKHDGILIHAHVDRTKIFYDDKNHEHRIPPSEHFSEADRNIAMETPLALAVYKKTHSTLHVQVKYMYRRIVARWSPLTLADH